MTLFGGGQQRDTTLHSNEVFTPGTFPEYTYVQRDEASYELILERALGMDGIVTSIAGPSKSGKTVLVERVVGRDNLITVAGGGIEHPRDLWDHVLNAMEAPSETTRTTGRDGGGSVEGGGSVSVDVPYVGKVAATAKVTGRAGLSSSEAQTFQRNGLQQVVREIAHSDFVVLIDDFHYMHRDVQEEVAKQIKEAVRNGVKIVTASVPHRSDDVVRANPELRGRVMAVDVATWRPENLVKIAMQGFSLLNFNLTQHTYDVFAVEAAGSPQLMQTICLSACFEMGIDKPGASVVEYEPPAETVQKVMVQTAQVANARSLVDVLDNGPRTRGTERRIYRFVDGTSGDVYRCILKAVSADPPLLSLTYDNIYDRIRAICVSETPPGSSISTACSQIAKLAANSFKKERAIDWDEQKGILDIPDPYLLFYMRWSGRLLEPER